IMKQRQSVNVSYNNKASPAVVDTLLQVDDDSPTSLNSSSSTPTLGSIISPKDTITPSRLARSDVNSKSTGNLRQLEDGHHPLRVDPLNHLQHNHTLSDPAHQQRPNPELKRSNTSATLPVSHSGD